MEERLFKLRESVSENTIGSINPVTLDKERMQAIERVPRDLYFSVKDEDGSWTVRDEIQAGLLSRMIILNRKLDIIAGMIKEKNDGIEKGKADKAPVADKRLGRAKLSEQPDSDKSD